MPDCLADTEYVRPRIPRAWVTIVRMLGGSVTSRECPDRCHRPDADGCGFRLPISRSNSSTTFADQAVIAIENVRLFDEVQAKTRDLSEALTYQTGSANILSVIASSPTDVDRY